MRIFLVYPGVTWSVFDVAQGYHRALEALGHEVTAYNYHTYYQAMGNFLSWGKAQGIKLPWGGDFSQTDASLLASERVLVEWVDCLPDITLIVTGLYLHRRAYELLARLRAPMVTLFTESPYLKALESLVTEKGHVRAVLTNERLCVPLYQEAAPDGVRVEYLPHAYDPKVHYPRPVGPKYRHDVFFHGTLWSERQALFVGLADRLSPLDVRISGIVPGSQQSEGPKNVVENDRLALYYNGARVALNHHRRSISPSEWISVNEAQSLGPRAYEIAANGTFQLCDDTRPELGDVFGDTVATYRASNDLESQIRYYMEHGDEAADMACEAMARVRGCTYLDRARDILEPLLQEVA